MGKQQSFKQKRASAAARQGAPAPGERVSMRESILLVAGVMFAEKGYSETSIRDIAAQSGAGLSTVLYHFQSKDRLFLEAIRHFTLELGQLNGIFAPLFTMEASDRRKVTAALLKTIETFLHACHLAPQASKVIGLYTRVLTEGNAKALQMLLDCFAGVQAELPQFCKRVRPGMSETEIAFFQQLLWSQLQYTVVSKRLVLYDMKLRDYTAAYLSEAARHICISCCLALDLPLPRAGANAR